MIARFLSFFIPVTIKKFPSKINSTLEVTWNNGKLVLDTPHTNYSYGNLQKILRRGLRAIGFTKVKQLDSVLILGLGAGSVIDTLRNEIGYTNKITSIELDPAVIEVGKKFFQLDQFDNHDIITVDVFEFALKNTRQYDLIILDIFQDADMPNFLFEKYFIDHLKRMFAVGSTLLFNTIALNSQQNARNTAYIEHFDRDEYHVKRLSKIQNHNEIIIIKKL
ncbi:spermidine synthase [Flavobacterium sp. HSC-61S13]|uniref:spermidine synthase n=1 Tax=Flavobacterium sp. HSC-61S13 TaxID=2910963 RepID=UPI0020A16105|nr:spermidine synthase [Flavobacterium sp. HSC-61S13]MCP1995840.1 spermidine synthase [Flavobacterium sp. HSC-61S13]